VRKNYVGVQFQRLPLRGLVHCAVHGLCVGSTGLIHCPFCPFPSMIFVGVRVSVIIGRTAQVPRMRP
jgi:hypothetical protein